MSGGYIPISISNGNLDLTSGTAFSLDMSGGYTPINVSNGNLDLTSGTAFSLDMSGGYTPISVSSNQLTLSNVASLNGSPYPLTRNAFFNNINLGTNFTPSIQTLLSFQNPYGSNVYVRGKVVVSAPILSSSNANNDFQLFLSDQSNANPISGVGFPGKENEFDATNNQPFNSGIFLVENSFTNAPSTLFFNISPDDNFFTQQGFFITALFTLTPTTRVDTP
jgi:hypothetical protein